MPADRFIHPRAGHSRKVSSLTDLEYRLWTTYLLAADDFGVLRDAPIAFQASSDALAARKPTQIKHAVQHILDVELLHSFEHQGQRYLYQRDWQTWQKVSYPRGTDNPLPTREALDSCDGPTRELFQLHPGGKGRKIQKRSGNIPETVLENSENVSETFPTTRAGAPAKRLTANGDRLSAHGSEGGPGETDVAWVSFKAAYPAHRRVAGNIEERMFFDAISSGETTLASMLGALENHKASDQWQDPSKIPNLRTWLEGKRWDVVMAPRKLAGTTDKTAGNAAALQRFVERHNAAN